jgi:dipeptidyl-peptidase 4
MRTLANLLTGVILLQFLGVGSAPAATDSMLDAYHRAEAVRADKIAAGALNLALTPVWVPHSDRFWFREQTSQGWRYTAVDPEHRNRGLAFDHARLALAITHVIQKPVDADHLPLGNLVIEDSRAHQVSFTINEQSLACDIVSLSCAARDKRTADPLLIVSPNGAMAIIAKGDNIWVRDLNTGSDRQLTQNGEAHFSYGKMPDAGLLTILKTSSGRTFPLFGVQWSPDSRRLVVTRVDERGLPDYFFLQSVPYDGTLRPKVLSLRTALSGETKKAVAEVSIIDVTTGARIALDTGPDGLSQSLWWSSDNTHFLAIQGGDYSRTETLFDIDATSGAMRPVLREESSTFLQVSPLEYDEPAVRYLAGTNEVIWFSQRDGWNHLYLVDVRTGAIKAQLGKGPWSVQNIVYVDEPRRLLYFTAAGREFGEDPYFRHLYSIRLDGSGLKLLTLEAADHAFPGAPNPALSAALAALGFPSSTAQLFARSGRYFIDTSSTLQAPPVSVVRAADGRVVMPLVKADITGALKAGWITPEPFHAKAADGATDLYGLIVKPSGFDPSRRYPVIDCIYNGPQVVTTPHDFAGVMTNWMMSCAESFAQLGFVTLVMDGRGTPMRSKTFQDYMYNNMQEFALEDHVAVLKALSADRPYMDLARLGVIGHSFGGFAAMKAILGYPDFYKAAVASAGPYDMYGMYPLDAFFAPPTFADQPDGHGAHQPNNWGNVDLTQQAASLRGKLLIAYGDLDENALPAITARMVSALINANKEFDLIYLPNRSHSFSSEPYFIRRTWDFFVRNLMGAEPPKDYTFGSVR